jgi:hypothetical protein
MKTLFLNKTGNAFKKELGFSFKRNPRKCAGKL